MAIVRELVTLLKYDVDRSGIDEYSSALKNLAGWIASAFAAKKVMDMADAWATVEARVGLATTSVADQQTALNALFDMSQRTGQSYTETANLFTVVGRNAKELGLNLQQQLDLTETINKAMVIGGGNKESQKAALMQLGQALGSGVLRGEELNSVMEQAPRLAKAIADAFGVPIGKLKALGASGKLTSKELSEGLLKQAPALNGEFEKMPLTFARAFQVAENRLGKFINDVGKATGIWQTLAEAIVSGTEWAFQKIEDLADAVGGLSNLMQLLGIAIFAALGPSILAMIGWIVVAVRGLTLAGIAAAAPWWLIAGAIFAVGLAVQDVWTWMRGGKSITEDLIGPFENWRSTVVGAVDEISTRFMAWGDIAADAFDDLRTRVMVWSDAIGEAFDENTEGFANLKEQFLNILPDNWDPLKFLREGITASREQIDQIRGLLTQMFPEMAKGADNWTLGGEIRKTLNDLATMLASVKEVFRYLNMTPTEILGEIGKKVHLDSRGNVTFGQAPAPAVDPVTGAPMPAPDPARSPRDFPLPYSSDRLMPGNLVPPSALLPPGANSNVAPVVTSNTTVNITTANDNPAGIGAAAAAGAQRGTSDGLSRELRNVMPGAEFGLSR